MKIQGYQIIDEIGQGGMAKVYLAVQESLNRNVALKVMSPVLLAADPSFGDRFLTEGKTVAQLQHPGIVQVYDIGASDEYYFLAMEYLPGGDLKARIEKGMTEVEALQILRQLGDILQYSHTKNIVHRDIKPENVLFDEQGRAVLTDFGIARAMTGGSKMTRAGMSVGTPQYMSPEQARGHQVDGRSDLYGMGVLLHEMLTGKVPFDADDTYAVGLMHINDPIPKLPVDFSRIQYILDRLLAKEPEVRFSNGQELVKAIDDLLMGKTSILPDLPEPQTDDVVTVEKRPLPKPILRWTVLSGSVAVVFIILLHWMISPSEFVVGEQGAADSSLADVLKDAPERQSPDVFLFFSDDASQTEENAAVDDVIKMAEPGSKSNILAESKPDRESAPGDSALFSLTITTDPPDARVRIMNISEPYTPGIPLRPGQYTIRIDHAEGYQDWQEDIHVVDDAVERHVRLVPVQMPDVPSQETLEPLAVSESPLEPDSPDPISNEPMSEGFALRVFTTPRDAFIRIQGNRMDRGQEFTHGMLLPPGDYEVVMSRPGYETLTLPVEITNQDTQVVADLKPEPPTQARMTIRTDPPDARVSFMHSGRLYSPGMPLDPGKYSMLVQREGYEDRLVDVQVRDRDGGMDLEFRVALAPKPESLPPSEPKIGDSWTEPYTGMEFKWVPGGCYQMGCDREWAGWGSCFDSNNHVHEVCLDGFWMGKFEVTQGQWQRLMNANPSWFPNGNDYPVERVNWNDTQKFIQALTSRSPGYRFRLPTEAEWEYACRSGGRKQRYCGGDELNAVAWHERNSNERSQQVGLKEPNALGIYDMTGNVWEWTQDVWSIDAYSRHERMNPVSTSGTGGRTVRGGSWKSPINRTQSVIREPQRFRSSTTGFRLVREK